MVAEAHLSTPTYYNIVVDVLDYERTEYTGFDLVKMKLSIENLDTRDVSNPSFVLGGAAQYVDDPVANPDTLTKSQYADSTYAEVRGRGGNVSVEECASTDRFNNIPSGGVGETLLCFMIGKAFEPDGLLVSSWLREHNHYKYSGWHESQCYSAEHSRTKDHRHHDNPDLHGSDNGWGIHNTVHACDVYHVQVIPFNAESVFCFDHQFDWCNADNIQPIDGMAVPQPAPEPDPEPPAPPAHATLLHTIYQNHTGTLAMVFDRPVIASSPDRIQLIHDIDKFIEDGRAPHLGDSEPYTVDGKRQSAVLVFALDDALRMAVTESLRSYTDLALLIDTRAIYSAEDFTDIVEPDGSPILVPDIVVVR